MASYIINFGNGVWLVASLLIFIMEMLYCPLPAEDGGGVQHKHVHQLQALVDCSVGMTATMPESLRMITTLLKQD